MTDSSAAKAPDGATLGVIRKAVAAMPAWRPPAVEADIEGAQAPIRRLSLNESAYPPSPKVVAAVAEAAATAYRYPDPRCRDVAARLSERVGIPVERIGFGNGSHELIMLVGQAFVDPGTAVVVPNPSFQPYQTATRLAGGEVVAVPVAADGANDVAAMLAATSPKTRIVYAATPNNPTGALLTPSALERLVSDAPEGVLLIVDEAYYEFGRLAGGADVLAALKKRRGPWLVLRTFSKAYNLAGLRIGYVYSSDAALIEAINKVRGVFSVNRLAQAAAVAALDDEAYALETMKKTAAERDRLAQGLAQLGCPPLPSAANFVAARMPMPAADAVARLSAAGLMTVPVGGPPFERHVRFTVGTPADTDAVLYEVGKLVG
jgi:histidinol-phosphate aminotransferase